MSSPGTLNSIYKQAQIDKKWESIWWYMKNKNRLLCLCSWSARCDLPGVIATGKTKAIVEKNIFSAVQFHLEGLKEERLRIPKAQAESEMLVFAV